MTTEVLSLRAARRLALNAQLLDGRTKLPGGKEGAARVIEKLGYVQIDTISVVERAHHHTLWTRRADYTPEMLGELHAKDRRVFEYWGHAASYLPMADYRFYMPLMRSFDKSQDKWVKERLEKCGHLMKPVLDRISKEGPLGSKDFEPPKDAKRGTWWDWKPNKMALELLFWRGELMITERRKFQKIYDLTERVLPEGTDTSIPDDDVLGRFLVERALFALGAARARDIQMHIRIASKDVISKSLRDLEDEGDVVPLSIEGGGNAEFYALSATLEKSKNLKKKCPQVFILSPFDNLIIQRARTERIFCFDYTLECYVPAPKRKYGYFVLPILWGEEFVGRLDPKADRKSRVLIIRSLIFEAGFSMFDEFLPPFAKKLTSFARFNNCEKVVLEKVSPKSIGRHLRTHLEK